jgi:hypothetical protein
MCAVMSPIPLCDIATPVARPAHSDVCASLACNIMCRLRDRSIGWLHPLRHRPMCESITPAGVRGRSSGDELTSHTTVWALAVHHEFYRFAVRKVETHLREPPVRITRWPMWGVAMGRYWALS